METTSTVKEKVNATVATLPPQGLEELSHYLDFLSYKYQSRQPSANATLGGLWENTPLDVTDEDVRSLRRRFSDDLMDET
jgi:hypothetical protein